VKTDPSARYLVAIRFIMVCTAIAFIAGTEFVVSRSLATRINQTTARQTEAPQAPNVSLSDLMASAR
jgi:hypothetical protein